MDSIGRLPRRSAGFTLVELLVVLSVIGVLVAILLPAVQYARESARAAHCRNNLKQLGLALQNFHAAHNRFPPGNDETQGLGHSWLTHVMPHLEQVELRAQYNFGQRWDAGTNASLTAAVVPTLRCPSGVHDFPGDTDYGGIIGSSLSGLKFGHEAGQAWSSGSLPKIDHVNPFPVTLGMVRDGASQTAGVAEITDRPSESGRWGSGTNCFAHENGPINTELENGIHSFHGDKAHALLLDGSVHALYAHTDLYVLGALCTRDAQEVIDWQ